MKKKRSKKLVGVLFSGGLDSTATLIQALHQEKEPGKDTIVFALSIYYGQRNLPEVYRAREIVKDLSEIKSLPPIIHKEIDISPLVKEIFSSSTLVGRVEDKIELVDSKEKEPSSYVPFRNLIFHSIAFAYLENFANQVSNVSHCILYSGIQPHELYSYWDAIPQFAKLLKLIADLRTSYSEDKVFRYLAPFANYKKGEIVDFIRNHYGEKYLNILKKSWTCYSPIEQRDLFSEEITFIPCKECPACLEREPILPQQPVKVSLKGE